MGAKKVTGEITPVMKDAGVKALTQFLDDLSESTAESAVVLVFEAMRYAQGASFKNLRKANR
jgi:hypothetical protein